MLKLKKKKKKKKPSKIGQNNPRVFFGGDAWKNLWTISLHKLLAAIAMVIYIWYTKEAISDNCSLFFCFIGVGIGNIAIAY